MDNTFISFLRGETSPDEPQAAAPKRRCGKLTNDGTPCLKAPIRGGTVCKHHGGGSPAVIAKANETLMKARDIAAGVLLEVVEWWRRDTCKECGFPKQDPAPAIRAAIAVLDRTGFGPTASLKVSQEGAAPWTAWLTNEELQQGRSLRETGLARMNAGEPPVGEVREFDIPEQDKMIWLPKNERPSLPTADETIEAVYIETPPEVS